MLDLAEDQLVIRCHESSMSCLQFSSWLKGKLKESKSLEEKEYEYWKQMYNNAKVRQQTKKRVDQHYGDDKFKSVHSWLQDLESDSNYGYIFSCDYNCYRNNHNYDYIDIKTFEKPTSRRWLHSGIDSDYSFWSLDDTSETECLSETPSEYRAQVRRESLNFYAVF